MGEVMLNLLKAGALTSVVVLALVGCDDTSTTSTDFGAGSDTTELQAAYDTCEDQAGDAYDSDFDNTVFEMGDEGHTLLIDGAMTDDIASLACILSLLDISDALISEIDATTAMMGRQEADSGDYHYAWSYHPDSGTNMTVTDDE